MSSLTADQKPGHLYGAPAILNDPRVEDVLCEMMGYRYCLLFERARVALMWWLYARAIRCDFEQKNLEIPSNICPQVRSVMPLAKIIPVSQLSGLAVTTPQFQLYGYRLLADGVPLEIDPLMTGAFGKPFADTCIISFGANKTISLGAGGAMLTNNPDLYEELNSFAFFPEALKEPLKIKLVSFYDTIEKKRDVAALWDRHLGDCGIRNPGEQVIPWRVIRRFPKHRNKIVSALRDAGIDAGTNFPPLHGVIDPRAVQWGKQVLNLWTTPDYDEPRIQRACEIIKRAADANR